jgi:predicted ATPase
MALSVDQGFALYCAHGTILRGGALTAQEQGQAGITQMLQGLEALHTTGAALRRPYYLAVLAEGYAKVQQAREGLTLLTTALEVVHKSAERVHEAELYRLKGEILQQCASDTPQVEACFRHALHIAQRQQAKLLELRAAMSLSRLWQRQGQRAAARELLAEVYGWFTEGFNSVDLQEAKAVLAELA